jgi:hypothetical protein
MHEEFRKFTDGLDEQLRKLLQMAPLTLEQPIRNSPKGGVYLFTENGVHLYVGRTKRHFSDRLKGHVNTATDCPFAFRIARKETGFTESAYSGDGTRKKLLANPHFVSAYEAAKKRIKEMEVRWIHEPEPTRQALLEIYVSVILKTPHNDFDTH